MMKQNLSLQNFFLLNFIFLLVLQQVALADGFLLKQTMFEGESKQYIVGDYVYNVTLVAVFDSKLKAQFEVNGERTKALSEDEIYKLADGARIQARDVLPQEAGDGRDLVQFNFFPVDHPEAAKPPAEIGLTPASEPPEAAVSPGVMEKTPTENVSAVDTTSEEPEMSWWGRFIGWLKNVFS
jgi:hypothetical protein